MTPPHDHDESPAPAALQLVDELRHERLVAGGLADDTPTTCTSFSTAAAPPRPASGTAGRRRRRSRGRRTRWRSTLAPRSWPSWPILATSMRGRRPSSAANAVDVGLRSSSNALVVPRTLAVHAGDAYGSRPGAGRTPPPSRRSSRRPWRGPERRRCTSASRLPSPARALVERVERGAGRRPRRGSRARCSSCGDLLLADLGVVDVEHVDHARGRSGTVLVDADDDVLAAVDARPGGAPPTPRCAASACPTRPPWSCRPSASTSSISVPRLRRRGRW